MILSQAKLNELLKIFENPKSVEIYNKLREKEDMKNASKFINNYHIYGPPPRENYDNINRNTSLNSKNNNILKNSTFKSRKFQTYQDLEIQRSLTNLRLNRQQYLKEQNTKSLKNRLPINKEKYGTYSTSTYSSEFLKNQTLYNNILNSNTLKSTNFPYEHYNYNKNSFNQKLVKSSKLSEIPANPEDVEIKELPANYTLSMNPISSSNLGMVMPSGINMHLGQNEPPMISQTINEPHKIIEEINTDIIPNDELQQKEESLNEEINENIQNQEKVPEETEPEQPKGKYLITEFNGPVKLPPGYSTDDEDEYKAIQFLNEDLSTWKKQIDKNNIIVYSKLYKMKNEKGEEVDNIMFRADITLDFPASEVNRQLHDFNLRKKWEKSLEKGKLLKEQDLGNGLRVKDYYSYIKMPFIFADRDMIVREKIWENYLGEKDCCLGQCHTIEHPDFPQKEKPVRAEMENRGEYIKPINSNQCKLYYCSKFDMKLSAPVSMMEGKGSEGQEKWVKEFIKHCGK